MEDLDPKLESILRDVAISVIDSYWTRHRTRLLPTSKLSSREHLLGPFSLVQRHLVNEYTQQRLLVETAHVVGPSGTLGVGFGP